MAFDAQSFKQALAQFASGVTVVTTQHAGERAGVTASSFTSLSLEPPLVLVCLAKGLSAYQLFAQSGVFAVNVLGVHQLELGQRFAGLLPDSEDRFDGLAYGTATTGSPLLPDSLCWLDCRVWNIYDGGDHSIFVGEVLDLDVADANNPLLYYKRDWQRHEAL
jgi:flavin reductase (DIM6/NTAB) family NADH-FMN oxidoreductase RutF